MANLYRSTENRRCHPEVFFLAKEILLFSETVEHVATLPPKEMTNIATKLLTVSPHAPLSSSNAALEARVSSDVTASITRKIDAVGNSHQAANIVQVGSSFLLSTIAT